MAEKSQKEEKEAGESQALASIAEALRMMAEQQAGTQEALQALLSATEQVQAGIDGLMSAVTAPRVKSATASKGADGKWQLSSTETLQ